MNETNPYEMQMPSRVCISKEGAQNPELKAIKHLWTDIVGAGCNLTYAAIIIRSTVFLLDGNDLLQMYFPT